MAADSLKQIGKHIRETREDVDFALGRKLPFRITIERIRDIFRPDLPIEMVFTTKHDTQEVRVDIRFLKPPSPEIVTALYQGFCQAFELGTTPSIFTVAYEYQPGSVTVYLNGASMDASKWYEYSSNQVYVSGGPHTESNTVDICYEVGIIDSGTPIPTPDPSPDPDPDPDPVPVTPDTYGTGQAQGQVETPGIMFGQAQALLDLRYNVGQSQARIKNSFKFHGQAQGMIDLVLRSGQAKASIRRTSNQKAGFARAWIGSVTVSEQAPGTLQAFINAVPTGTTAFVPPGIYRETATCNRAMTLIFTTGTRFRGSTAAGTKARKTAFNVTGSNVTLDFRAPNIRFQEFILGSFPNDAVISVENGATNATIRGDVAASGGVMDCDHGSYAGISFPGGVNTGNDSIVDGMSFLNNPGPGIRVWGNEDVSAAKRIILRNCYFYNCSAAANSVLDPAHAGYVMADGTVLDAGNESGGIKAGAATSILIENNTLDHCNAMGIWIDVYAPNSIVRFNTVHHSWRSGIHDEISAGTQIYGNKIWECGWEANQLTIWGAGILGSTTKDVFIHDNYVAWCRQAISFIGQTRSTLGSSGDVATSNTLGQTVPIAIGTFGTFQSPTPIISPNTQLAAGAATWFNQGIPAYPESGH